MLITRDGPDIRRNHNFFILDLHSTLTLVLTVLSRQRHAISDGDMLPLKKGRNVAHSFN